MSALPNGWSISSIGNVVEKIIGGGTPSKSINSYFEGDFPFMTVKDMRVSRPVDTIDKITQEAIKNSATNIIEIGTLIVSTRMGLGKIVSVDFPVAINQDLKALYLTKSVNKSFFEYQYRFLAKHIESLGTGTTVKGIRVETLKEIELSIPPLNEQIRIANKLDSVLAKVDVAQARLEKIPTLLKRFRQSVLAAATSGELTREWREFNLEQLENFFISDAIDSYDGRELELLPSNWCYLPFHKAGEIKSNLVDPKLTPEAIHLAPNHVEPNTGKILELVTVEQDEVKSGKHKFFSGQIVYSKIRPYLNKVCFVEFDGLCSADMYPIDAKIETKYLLYYMLSERFVNWTSQQQGRVVLPKINQNALNKIPVPTPSINEQKEIVRRVESLFALADTVEKQYLAAKQRLDRLSQSILAKAFRGELVPQDPNDKPAAELLKRIQAERQAQPAANRKHSKPA